MAATNALVLLLVYITLFAASTATFFTSNQTTTTTTYIVFMDPSHKPKTATQSLWYAAHLRSLSIPPARHLLYSYSSALHAYAAALLPHHLPLLRRHPSVLLLLPDTLRPLLTTRSPLFLGLPPYSPVPPPPPAATDVIIAVLDTGVWPESPSFSDTNLPPIPSRWRGHCDDDILCNRKLIGARSFSAGAAAGGGGGGGATARDRDGHGTHTASTAAGAPVANASLLGYAPGTARGMAPAARVAAYKVCWSAGCYASDILAGIDSAIADGVDVISLSLGGAAGAAPFSRDPVAIGTLAAVRRGIFVACSAGNSGPGAATLTNTAPWIATVGAGTIDRDFPAFAELGNGDRHVGVSLYSGKIMVDQLTPIVYDKMSTTNSSKFCLPGSLDPAAVRGKVVLCDRGINARVEKGEVVRDAGGVGMILANTAATGNELVADSHLLPAVAVGAAAGERIKKYVVSNPNPTVGLSFGGTVLGVQPSPVVAAFSSRGPGMVVPQILKPDLIAPGVNILAGWSGAIAPTGLEKDERRSEFNILSGTSMSCPHISGVAALLKAAHPDWSPSAIKSALMTTAYTVDKSGSPLRDAFGSSVATPFAYGSGHVDPEKALSPGLIYDISMEDYIAFLCSSDQTTDHIRAIAKNITCSKKLKDRGNLNYPSFSVIFGRKRVYRYSRELTNVGAAGSFYNVKFGGPASVSVVVKPMKLFFGQVGEKLKYSITFTTKVNGPLDVDFGWITWNDEQHQVRSPIAYTWKSF